MKFELQNYLIDENSSLKSALEKIDAHHQGFLFTTNTQKSVTGLVTDGDIRRALINGIRLTDKISKCANVEFFWVDIDTPKESILKKLDSGIRFVPLLDEFKRLIYIITKDHLPLRDEEPVYVRSRAPVRVSFGGGGSDLTHYFSKNSGAVINAAISIYSHATLRLRSDNGINISSMDLDETLRAADLTEALNNPGKFGLIIAVLQVVRPDYGFDLYLNSDFSVGSGLGGSATITAAVLGCLNMFRNDKWDKYELAELAFQAERLHLGILGGWQDQYASVFGGFNLMEFGMDQNIVNPIRIDPDTLLELEESLVLCDTGILHNSGDVHKDQKESMKSKKISKLVKENVQLTYTIRNHLLRGRLSDFGIELNRAWQLKKKFSNSISSPEIDKIYQGALDNGASGGKLLGAGGGGYFIFHVFPFEKHRLCNYLASEGLMVKNFRFESNGVQSWAVRDKNLNRSIWDKI